MCLKDNSVGNSKTWSYPRFAPYRQQLERAAASWFRGRGKRVRTRQPYILASRDDWADNIILPEVWEYIVAERKRREVSGRGFPLHKYIHHGLSSQAMMFNLVGPLIQADDLDAMRGAFGINGIPWPSRRVKGCFEVEDRSIFNEDRGTPTSIDLAIRGEEGPSPLFIEAKWVEQEFGGCSVFSDGDCDGQNPAKDFSMCYLHHIGRTYWERLMEFDFLEGPMGESPVCVLSSYYQFFREVLFALKKGGCFILLVDGRNPVFQRNGVHGQRGLIPFLTSFVPESLHRRIKTIPIQQIVQAIKDSDRHDHWINEFERKYGMG